MKRTGKIIKSAMLMTFGIGLVLFAAQPIADLLTLLLGIALLAFFLKIGKKETATQDMYESCS